MTTTQRPSALDGLRVLDLGGLSTAYSTRLLADFGADVILVEPPEGDATRRLPPFAGDSPGPERSLVFLAFHTNKRSVVLEIGAREGRQSFLSLVRSADVVMEGYQRGYLAGLGVGYEALRRRNPRLVLCSITPFGQTGPHAGYKGLDLHAEAMGGLMMLQGDPSKAPCMSPAFIGYELAGVHAALGVMHALFARETTGRGQRVDVSLQEASANVHFIVSQYGMNSTIVERPGIGAGGGTGIFACKDGHVGFSPILPNQFQALAQWMDNPALQDPVFGDLRVRIEQAEFINAFVTEFISRFTMSEFVDEAQRRRIPAAPVSTPAGLARNPHLLARDYFQEARHPVVGPYRLPGPPGRFSATPWRISRPAPRLGEHTQEVLKVVEAPPPAPAAALRGSRARPGLPLEGVRITDLTRIWVGPYGTRQLADFGAEVIKIESSLFDVTSRLPGILPQHPELNRNKMSVTVDLHRREGQDLVKRLVQVSDAVTENYAAGALQRWGLDYESLRQVKPDIVYMSMPGWGATGPFAHHVLFGLQAQTASGLTHLWGHADSPPSLRCGIYYADFFVGALSGLLLEMALYHRRRTGRGQYIEISQVETQANALAVPLLDYFVNRRDGQPTGNARPYAAPHGVYPCKGRDTWCAVACTTEEEWEGLVRALTPPLGQPPAWTRDPRFATFQERLAHRDELDQRLAEWTRALTPRQVMRMLQAQGVAAAAVQNTEEVFYDPHLRARGYIVPIQHSNAVWGTMEHATFPAHLSETPGVIRRGAPALGEHNDRVLRELLGLSAGEVRDLREAKALV
ncbi:MAG: CoA transferase [Chloroflexi bacterium]|nr:CoA transferase [Chloroflexota bacterium]